MNGQLVRKIAPTASSTNRIDVANNVGHGHVGSRKLFHVAMISRHPRDGRIVAFRGHFFPACAADGAQRIVINFAAHHYGDFRIEKLRQSAKNTALRLAAKSQKNKIVPRQQRVDDLRDDRVFVPMHAREERFVLLDHTKQVLAHLTFHGARNSACVKIWNALKFAERPCSRVS